VLAILALLFIKRALRIPVISFTEPQVLVNNRLLAIVPPFSEKGNGLAIRNGKENVIRFGWNENALPFVHVNEQLLAGFGVFFNFHSRAVHQQDVFVKFRVAMVAPNLARFDKLVSPLHDRRLRDEGKNSAPSVTNGVEVALWFE